MTVHSKNSLKEGLKRILIKTILENPYIPHNPHILWKCEKHGTRKKGNNPCRCKDLITKSPQTEYLLTPEDEALYGGAAGGGKSDALLMGALQYVYVPGYAAILLRRTYTDLTLPEGLIERAEAWLGPTNAKWSEKKKTWKFPSNATLSFGFLEHEKHKFRYQGAAFQYIGFDELTQFTQSQYRYLFSRLRRLENTHVPLRMRSASNPGGEGHDWVKQRFIIEGESKGRPFIPARLEDNPALDRDEYVKSLNKLDPTTRQQLLKGDWTAAQPGNMFQRGWFDIVEEAPAQMKRVRYWDLAATEAKEGKDPDWTAGVLMGESEGIYYILNIIRARISAKAVEDLVKQTAELDGHEVMIYMEQEPGSAGKSSIDHYGRNVLKGFAFWGKKTTGAKTMRAAPLASAAEADNVKLVRGPWIGDFLDEVEQFPLGSHDDMVDAGSGAFEILSAGSDELAWIDASDLTF